MTAPKTDKPTKDRPWLIRTYSGHSTAAKSNELYRTNLARGQTGLSVAFDLPTQTGYDSDHPLAKGEVGKVGVPVNHLGDMRTLFDGIPLERMNTSMTINAPAAWLLSLYIATAEAQGADRKSLQGIVGPWGRYRFTDNIGVSATVGVGASRVTQSISAAGQVNSSGAATALAYGGIAGLDLSFSIVRVFVGARYLQSNATGAVTGPAGGLAGVVGVGVDLGL